MPKKHCRGSASILFLYSWSRIVEYRKIIYSEKIGSIPSYRSHHFSSSCYKLFLYYIEEKGLEAFYSCHKSFYIIVYGIHHILVGIGSFDKLYLFLIHVYIVAVQPAGLISRAVYPSSLSINCPSHMNFFLPALFRSGDTVKKLILKGEILWLVVWGINIRDIVYR